MRLVELQQAAAAVLEVEQAQALAAQMVAARKAEARAALAAGECWNWLVAGRACELAKRAGERAELLRVERASLRDSAGEVYRASHLQTERVACVVAALEDAERVVGGRREQAQADDRYAARRHWKQMKAG